MSNLPDIEPSEQYKPVTLPEYAKVLIFMNKTKSVEELSKLVAVPEGILQAIIDHFREDK